MHALKNIDIYSHIVVNKSTVSLEAAQISMIFEDFIAVSTSISNAVYQLIQYQLIYIYLSERYFLEDLNCQMTKHHSHLSHTVSENFFWKRLFRRVWIEWFLWSWQFTSFSVLIIDLMLRSIFEQKHLLTQSQTMLKNSVVWEWSWETSKVKWGKVRSKTVKSQKWSKKHSKWSLRSQKWRWKILVWLHVMNETYEWTWRLTAIT